MHILHTLSILKKIVFNQFGVTACLPRISMVIEHSSQNFMEEKKSNEPNLQLRFSATRPLSFFSRAFYFLLFSSSRNLDSRDTPTKPDTSSYFTDLST